jgi:glycosyltransferase involved in cell wall biosynthesis
MAAGRPVACLDIGGPGIQVTQDAGFKVAASTPEQAVRDLSHALTALARDASLRAEMGRAGLERVCSEYSWEAKGLVLNEIYKDLVKERSHKM